MSFFTSLLLAFFSHPTTRMYSMKQLFSLLVGLLCFSLMAGDVLGFFTTATMPEVSAVIGGDKTQRLKPVLKVMIP